MRPSSSARIACIPAPGVDFQNFSKEVAAHQGITGGVRALFSMQKMWKRSREESAEASELFHRPISEDCLAINELILHRAKVTAVPRHAAVKDELIYGKAVFGYWPME